MDWQLIIGSSGLLGIVITLFYIVRFSVRLESRISNLENKLNSIEKETCSIRNDISEIKQDMREANTKIEERTLKVIYTAQPLYDVSKVSCHS